jgi:hypothetical protein
MAGWRQAVELAMTDEEICKFEGHRAIPKRSGAPSEAGANAAQLP